MKSFLYFLAFVSFTHSTYASEINIAAEDFESYLDAQGLLAKEGEESMSVYFQVSPIPNTNSPAVASNATPTPTPDASSAAETKKGAVTFGGGLGLGINGSASLGLQLTPKLTIEGAYVIRTVRNVSYMTATGGIGARNFVTVEAPSLLLQYRLAKRFAAGLRYFGYNYQKRKFQSVSTGEDVFYSKPFANQYRQLGYNVRYYAIVDSPGNVYLEVTGLRKDLRPDIFHLGANIYLNR